MDNMKITALALAVAAAVPFSAAAQGVAPPADGLSDAERQRLEARAPDVLRDTLDVGVSNGANDRALKSSSTPDFQLVATQGEKVVTMAVTSQISGRVRDGRLSYSQFSFKASTELEDDGAPTRIFGLKGFTGGTEVTLGYTHFFGALGTASLDRWAEPTQPDLDVAVSNCLQKHAGNPEIATMCDPEEFPQGDSRFLELYNPAGLRRQLDAIFPGPIKFVGVDATANQTDFDYLDPTSRTTETSSKFSYKASVFAGAILPSRVAAVTGTFTYLREYEAGDEFTACDPANPNDCATGLGAPNVKTRAVGSIEGRYAFGFSNGNTAQFALAPEVSYDFTERAFSIDVPFYFARDGDGKLRGGVRFTYLNERNPAGGRRDSAAMSVFIGVPFGLLN